MNKKYFFILLSISVFAIISLFFTNSLTQSMQGLAIYVGSVIFYIILEDGKEEKANIINWSTYALALSSLFYIFIQGAILKGGVLANRIDGNIGYANTYALLLLVGVYFNNIRENKFLSDIIEIILIIGVLFTGSRSTLFYLGIYVLLMIIINWKKKEQRFLNILNLIIAAIIYALIEKGGVGVVFILPIALIIIYPVLNSIHAKYKNIAAIVLVALSVPAMFLFNTNFAQRLKGVSLHTGEFQQRIYYFQDATKHILKNPFGSGINSFQYRQVVDQCAWYDVRYIHNSILQVGYDIGIIGMILFISLAIFGGIVVFKSKDKNKYLYLSIYITIFLHSLLDFDFAYSITFILILMIFVFNNDSTDILNLKNIKLIISVPTLIFSFYISFVSSCYYIGDKLSNTGSYLGAINVYKIARGVMPVDSDIYLKLGISYNYQYRQTGDENMVKEAIDSFKRAEELNPINPVVIANLAFTHEAIGDEENTNYYYHKLISTEKYNYDAYKAYYQYLNKRFNDTKDEKYNKKISELQQVYAENISTIREVVKKYFGEMPRSIS
ncbi:O-antigen ligase family protein [Clostridium cellulovorans]|uniref:O-antigen ligase family protein n=1 Tax=Clostridium cellulovorans TaxID=1493 RepID=UPI001F60D15B|nr:O-antigen ligase family protein [Clostridium cellulovorans]